MKAVGIVIFPGTQCDHDTAKAFLSVGVRVQWIWHKDTFDYKKFKAIVLAGGFSYGDYLRAGAMAARSPAMKSVAEAANNGWPVLGICNGFQVLCEAGLLPGALVKNKNLKFIDQWVELKLENPSPFWAKSKIKNPRLPIAHAEGCYFADADVLKDLEQNNQIWWRYEKNPNGSTGNIAGIMNKQKNVSALMPHPERALEDWMGSSGGFYFF